MVNKTLLYKYEYKNVEENSIPKFKPEEIGHILYTIEKGISSQRDYGNYALFEENPLEFKKFPVNFKNILNSTRLDITFLYKTVNIERDNDSDKIKGYFINDYVERVDVTSFFTNIKNSKSEHRIYQIGGRYSKSIEDIRGYRDDIRNKSLEEKKALLEDITKNSEFKSFHPKKQEFYLNILREIYNKLGLEKKYWKIQRRIENAVGRQNETRRYIKGEINLNANPFKVELKKFEFLKKDQVQIQRTKSLVYKRDYAKGTAVPELTIEDIGDILINVRMIPHYLDYEEGKHLVNFRNIKEGTRKDVTFHYAHIVPIFGDSVDERGFLKTIGQEITEQVTKVDNVSFFTNEKNGISEHRIYQIGARYEAQELTVNDLYGLGQLNYDAELYDEATQLLKRSLDLDPSNEEIKQHLIEIKEKISKSEK